MMLSIPTARDKHVSTRRNWRASRAAITLLGMAITLTAAGSLDPVFDGDGLLSLTACDAGGAPHAVIEQADGKLAIAGVCYDGNFGNFTLARVMPDGQFDDGFGSGGTASIEFADAFATEPLAMIEQDDDKLVMVGSNWRESSEFDFLLARWNTEGILDDTFGTDGL